MKTERTINKEQAMGFLLPLAMAVVYVLYGQYRYDNLYGDLDSHGLTTQATIIDKRIVHLGGDRPSHYYQMKVGFTVGDKMLRGHVQVTSDFYALHDAPNRVPIRYLPADPKIRELDPAMRDKTAQSNFMIILIFVFIAVANLFLMRGTKKKIND